MTNDIGLKTQCAAPDGTTGSFLYDRATGEPVSPVCRDLVELFQWTRANGWRESANLRTGKKCR